MENVIKKEIGYEEADKRTRVSLEKTALGLVLFFIINPLVFMLIRWAMNEYSFVLTYMQIFNKFLLFFGVLVFLKYFWLVTEKKPARIKEILHNHAPVTILLLFGLLMIVTTILNGASELSLYGDSYRGEGLFGFLSYIIYFLLTVFLLPDKYKKIVVKVLLATSAIIGCVIFADYVFFDAKYNFANKSGMILSNSNHLAYYLVVAAMFHGMMFVTAKKRGIKILYLCGFVLLTATLIMNNTLGSQIALFVGVLFAMVVYSVGKGKFQPVTIVLLVAALLTYVIMYYSDNRLKENITSDVSQTIYDSGVLLEKEEMVHETSGTARIILWQCTLKYIAERPLLGYGSDVTGERLSMESCSDRCHCEFLNYAVSFGIPTTLVYMIAIFMVYLRGLKKKKSLTDINYAGLCSAFAYLVSALVGNTMYYTAPFFFISLGLGYVMEEKE